MKLGDIKRGTKMTMFREVDQRAAGDAYEALFRYEESEFYFVAQSADLFNAFQELGRYTPLIIAFESGQYIYTFTGRLKEKMRGKDIVMLEQMDKIKSFNRRKCERDELRFNVKIYSLPEQRLASKRYEVPLEEPAMSDTTFDISSGGMCVITNAVIEPEHKPYFLVAFSLPSKDSFLLPAKLVRDSAYHRTYIGKFDYGFQFLFEYVPSEETRLTTAIMSTKLMALSRR